MGANPSKFKGQQLPVENVSWNDCQEFLKKINEMIPDLNLRLPTEAEWEYACRAGTTTPFSFGENITPEQVNYDGNYPYADGKEGQYREKTVEVKSLPANPWGLYEMHGNVWEWCSDWYGYYPSESAVDPIGPDKGEFRVLRGGSWIDNGGIVRSAYRDRFEPSSRVDFIGFRLVATSSGSVFDPTGPDEGKKRVLRGGSWLFSGRYVRSASRLRFEPTIRDGDFGFRLAADRPLPK